MVILAALSQPANPPLPPGPWPPTLQIMTLVKALAGAPAAERPAIARSISSDDLRVRLERAEPCSASASGYWTDSLTSLLREGLHDRVGSLSVKVCMREDGVSRMLRVETTVEGEFVTIDTTLQEGLSQLIIVTFPVLLTVSFLFLLVIALSVWTLARINRPLRELAGTVEKFGQDVANKPLPVRGAVEIRQLIQAFNRMQERVTELMEERRRMLMAVGHDLRTPLTRLKLRVELEPALEGRGDISRDLDLMQKMVNGALAYLNDEPDGEPFEIVDLGSLIESVALEFQDDGHDVSFTGAYGLECRCQATAITRAVANLIENSCRYATQTRVDVRAGVEQVVINVSDNGPGIPAGERERVLSPFERLDPARAAEGRLGLGLSIVSDIVRWHGGELVLLDAEPQGLLARITLPMNAAGDNQASIALEGV
ncbi:signal transduction histidine kinase [Rhodoblastus sphagnicola]|nr:signal transduction histidine kinase [Rhodoblastus sphagnicola]